MNESMIPTSGLRDFCLDCIRAPADAAEPTVFITDGRGARFAAKDGKALPKDGRLKVNRRINLRTRNYLWHKEFVRDDE
jgi:hypothetical protein